MMQEMMMLIHMMQVPLYMLLAMCLASRVFIFIISFFFFFFFFMLLT